MYRLLRPRFRSRSRKHRQPHNQSRIGACLIVRQFIPCCELSPMPSMVARWTLVASGLLSSITALAEPVSYERQIKPLLQRSCTACHNSQAAEGGLNLESVAAILRGGDSGQAVTIEQGDAAGSLLARVTGSDEPRMPPADNAIGARPLNDLEIDLLRQWIAAGSPDDRQGDRYSTNLSWQPIAGWIQPIYGLTVSRDGQYAAVGRGNRLALYQWPASAEAMTAFELLDPAVPEALDVTSARGAHLDLVQSLAFSPDGERLASGGFRDVKLWQRQLTPIDSSSEGTVPPHRLLALSRDLPQRAAIVRDDHSVELWNVEPWQLARILHANSAAPVSAVAWSPEPMRMAVAYASGAIAIWDLLETPAGDGTAYNEVAKLEANVPLSTLHWVDRLTLAGLDTAGRFHAWAITEEPLAIAELPITPPLEDVAAFVPIVMEDRGGVWCALRDGRMVAVGLPGGERLGEISTQGVVHTLVTSGDGRRVLSVLRDGTSRLWAAGKFEPLATWPADPLAQRRVEELEQAVERQRAYEKRLSELLPGLVSAHQAEQEAIKPLLASRDELQKQLAAQQMANEAASKAVSEGEAAVAAAEQAIAEAMQRAEMLKKDLEARRATATEASQKVREAEQRIADQQQAVASAEAGIGRAAQAIPRHEEQIGTEKQRTLELERRLAAAREQALAAAEPAQAVFARDGRACAIAGQDGRLRIYSTITMQPVAEFRGAPLACTDLCATEDRLIAIGRHGGTARFAWEPPWRLERVIGSARQSPFSDRVTALDFSPDGRWLAVGSGVPSRFGEVKLLNVASGEVDRDAGELHSDSVLAIRFSPDGRWLATASADKTARIVDPSTGAMLRTLEGHTHHVLTVAWSDDSRWLVTGSADQTAKVWDRETGEAARTIGGFGGELSAIAFLGRSPRFLSVSVDRHARIHDANNGAGVHGFPTADGPLFAGSADARGQHAFVGGQSGTVYVFQVEPPALLRELK